MTTRHQVSVSVIPPSVFNSSLLPSPLLPPPSLLLSSPLLPPPSLLLSPVAAEDPNAPHPVGPTMQPAVGVPLESRQDWHRNLEAAIQHHSTTLAKQPAISVVEQNGKVQVQANYSEFRGYTGTSSGGS